MTGRHSFEIDCLGVREIIVIVGQTFGIDYFEGKCIPCGDNFGWSVISQTLAIVRSAVGFDFCSSQDRARFCGDGQSGKIGAVTGFVIDLAKETRADSARKQSGSIEPDIPEISSDISGFLTLPVVDIRLEFQPPSACAGFGIVIQSIERGMGKCVVSLGLICFHGKISRDGCRRIRRRFSPASIDHIAENYFGIRIQRELDEVATGIGIAIREKEPSERAGQRLAGYCGEIVGRIKTVREIFERIDHCGERRSGRVGEKAIGVAENTGGREFRWIPPSCVSVGIEKPGFIETRYF